MRRSRVTGSVFFNRVAVFIAILQKPKNNLYDTVFGYFNRLWAIERFLLQLIYHT